MNKYESAGNFLRTTDICLGTALRCKGYKIVKIENDSLTKLAFFFEKNKGINKTIDQYFEQKLLVEPIQFFTTLKQIKTRIYNIKK